MTKEYTIENIVIANDVALYMLEHKVSLDKAYEEMKVPEDMRLQEDDIKDIITEEAWKDIVKQR